jgi:Reverse transcriptase (RNA-dependent DNA polymerase)
LGPLLFLIFINDIDAVCKGNTTLQLFADDAKLFSSVDFSAHSISLQQSLANLCAWVDQWQLSINKSKCSVLSTASKSHQVSSYYFNGISIPTNSTTFDLRVTICDDLTYQSHITNIVSKARQRFSSLMRGFVSRRLNIMRTAFIACIRPILEYNSLVWNPRQVHSIDVIEDVQRNFSKRILSLSSLTYLEILALLNLEPLELRRLRFELTYYYKILHNLTPFNPDIVFYIHTPPEASRSNSLYLQKPNNATTTLLSSFFCICIDAWNYLPSNLRYAQSTSAFKRAIKCVDFSRFLKGSSVK